MKISMYMILGLIGLSFVLMAGVSTAQKSETLQINRAVIKIDSLSCGGCFSSISAGLTSLDGYSGMGANLFRKLIAVDFVAPLTKEKISEKLAEVGYQGTVEYVNPILEKESFAYLESRRTGFTSGGGSCCSNSRSSGIPEQKRPDSILPPRKTCCTLLKSARPAKDL